MKRNQLFHKQEKGGKTFRHLVTLGNPYKSIVRRKHLEIVKGGDGEKHKGTPEGLARGEASTGNAHSLQHTTCPQLLKHILRRQVAGFTGRVGLHTADVVRLALVEGSHETLQLLPELCAHTVELEGALATPPCQCS